MLASSYAKTVNPNNLSLELAGFAQRTASREQIGPKDLYTKIVWLEDDDNIILFISLDTLYFPQKIADILDEHCHEEYRITNNNIIYNATHTHSAPSVALPHFGRIDDTYIDRITSEIIIGLAYCEKNKKQSSIETRVFPVGNKIIGRRRVGWDINSFFLKKKTLLLPNESQGIDSHIRTMKISTDDEECIATILNFSCHPVIANTSCYSSDFPGKITSDLSTYFGGVTVFLQGFCGDIRPNITTEKVPVFEIINYLKIIFNKKIFKVPDLSDFKDFCTDIFDRITTAHKENGDATSFSSIKAHSFKHKLISQSGKTTRTINVKIIRIDKIIFVSIPAEVNSKYIINLKKNFPDYTVFPLGYAEGMIGYLPYYKEIEEGGYEVNSAVNYNWDTPLSIESTEEFYNKLISELENLTKNG